MVCGSVARGRALQRSGAKTGDAIYVSGPLGGWTHREKIVPHLSEGQKLLGKATACIDVTDGLAIDLHRLCVESGVSAEIDTVPLLEGATLEQALYDGEDYELLYTAPPTRRVPGTRIGCIVSGKPGTLKLKGKRLKPRGYDHLARPRSD
jgi:thiamine-monophosphate kinase